MRSIVLDNILDMMLKKKLAPPLSLSPPCPPSPPPPFVGDIPHLEVLHFSVLSRFPLGVSVESHPSSSLTGSASSGKDFVEQDRSGRFRQRECGRGKRWWWRGTSLDGRYGRRGRGPRNRAGRGERCGWFQEGPALSKSSTGGKRHFLFFIVVVVQWAVLGTAIN